MMHQVPSKEKLVASLPIVAAGLTIRCWARADVDRFAAWPGYRFPYDAFDLSFRDMDASERDCVYRDRVARPDAIILAGDTDAHLSLVYLALHGIDWATRQVHNFGFRVHPHRRGRGFGTVFLQSVTDWLFQNGMNRVSVDVAASNGPAVRCYEKVGFVRVGTVWRDAADLVGRDLSTPRYAFLRPHIRMMEDRVQLRFWLMNLEAAEPRSPSWVDTATF
jgi:RimJ/RimL family protein N-acetyltransferase